MTNYLNRSLEPVLQRAVTEFPAVVLTGPRQSGKTTLLRHRFGNDYAYLSLELPDVRAAAEEDPRSFLARFPPPASTTRSSSLRDCSPTSRRGSTRTVAAPGNSFSPGPRTCFSMRESPNRSPGVRRFSICCPCRGVKHAPICARRWHGRPIPVPEPGSRWSGGGFRR